MISSDSNWTPVESDVRVEESADVDFFEAPTSL